MPVTRQTLTELRRMQLSINRRVNQTNRELTRAWSRAWHEISGEFREAIDDLIELGDGEWPTRSQVLRAQRATNAMKIATDALEELGREAGISITRGIPLIVGDVDRLTELIVDTQLPPGQTRITWSRMSEQQIRTIVRRTTQQITATTLPISRRSAEVMRSVLIRGVATGAGPRAAARQMMKRTRGAFTGGLHRATNIATTEMLDASRHAAHQTRTSNPTVLQGWRWLATLDHRTCGSCISMDGQEFPIDTWGPDDHQRGRCTAVPITRSWAELGFNIDEPDPFPRQSGREWYADQPADVQQQIMGRERAARLADGRLDWERVSYQHDNPGWRTSRSLRPLEQ